MAGEEGKINLPLHIQTILCQFDATILEVKMNENNGDLLNAGVLWSTEAKSGIKYWSGKLNFSTILDGWLDQAEGSKVQKAVTKMRLEGMIGEEANLDLMMFVNNKRRPDKNDPHLTLKVKIAKQVEPVAEEDLPPF